MINKQSLWFLTLFSLILVLSVYYITMPNDLLISNNGNYLKTEETNKEIDDVKTTIKESELLVTMRVNLEYFHAKMYYVSKKNNDIRKKRNRKKRDIFLCPFLLCTG